MLCHGLGNNHRIFELIEDHSIIQALNAAGFDCYSLDLRGAGNSRHPSDSPAEVTFDDYVQRDLPAFIQRIQEHSYSSQILWLGHSLGGLLGIASLSTKYSKCFRAFATVGSPLFFTGGGKEILKLAQWLSPWGAFDVTLVRYLAPFAGRIGYPKRIQSANLENIPPHSQRQLLVHALAPLYSDLLAQIEDWVENDAFRSTNQATDYRASLGNLTVPLLIVGGTVDPITPVSVTQRYFERVPKGLGKLALFGQAYGHKSDYGHGDLLVGADAATEVFPTLVAFFEAHATRVA